MANEFEHNHQIEDIRDLKDSLTKFSGALVGVAMTDDEELPQLWDPFTNQDHTKLLKEVFGLSVYAQWSSSTLNYKTYHGSRQLVSVNGNVERTSKAEKWGDLYRTVPQEFRAFSICLFLDAWAQKNDGSVNGLVFYSEKVILELKRSAGLFK